MTTIISPLLRTLLVILMLPILSSAQLNTGIVAHWNFNGNANDNSGNGLHGTAVNVTYTTGKSGLANTAAKFNGSTSYISVPYQSALNLDTFSICALVKADGFYSGMCEANSILWRGTQFNNGHYSLIYFDNPFDNSCGIFSPTKEVFAGQVKNLTTGPNTSQWYYTPNIVLQRWYCVITTFDGIASRTYVDGVLMSTFIVLPGTIGSSTEGLSIGRAHTNVGSHPYWMNGVIDDLRIYNKVLRSTDISSYCGLFPPPPEPEVSLVLPLEKTSYCPEDTFSLHYTVTTSFNTGNAFTAQLSDATGSFATPAAIGTVIATNSGTIACTIPAGFTPGTGYRIRISASNPAKLSDTSIAITINQVPTITHSGDTTGCLGDDLTLQINTTPTLAKVLWNGPNSFSDTAKTVTINNVDYSDSGRYIITANNNGCMATDTILLTVGTADFSLGNDSNICQGEGVLISANISGASYKWHDGSTLKDYYASEQGQYYVTATLGSCSHSDTINISVFKIELQLPEDTALCPDTSFPVSITDTFDSYLWSNFATTPIVTISTAGRYWLNVTKEKCTATDTFNVTQLEPYFSLGNDTTICNGRTLTLFANSAPGSMYTWQDGSTDSIFTVREQGFYHVKAQNVCGDFGDNINVTYQQCECTPFTADAFTPNNDGVNDKIGPILNCTPTDFYFIIANRRGEIVFETKEYTQKWDGRHHRVLAGQDTYYYFISITDRIGNTTTHKGSILLLR